MPSLDSITVILKCELVAEVDDCLLLAVLIRDAVTGNENCISLMVIEEKELA